MAEKKKKIEPKKLSKKARKQLDHQIEELGSFMGDLKRLRHATKIGTITGIQTREEAIETLKNSTIRSKKFMGGVAAFFVLIGLVSYGVHYYNQPAKGTKAFGICRTFLELYVEFPDFLRLASVGEFQNKEDYVVRIWFSQLDGFGQYRLDRLECLFRKGDDGNPYARTIMVNRRPVDRKLIDRFNIALPAIKDSEVDLTIPPNFPSRVSDLKFETDALRRPLF